MLVRGDSNQTRGFRIVTKGQEAEPVPPASRIPDNRIYDTHWSDNRRENLFSETSWGGGTSALLAPGFINHRDDQPGCRGRRGILGRTDCQFLVLVESEQDQCRFAVHLAKVVDTKFAYQFRLF